MVERGRPREFDRDATLRRAMRLFWTNTYEGTSMTDLTAAMSISAPSLYAAFGSKAALFREAVALYADNYGREIWDGLEQTPTIDEAVAKFLQATAEAYSKRGDPPGCMIVLGTQHIWKTDDPAYQDLQMRRRKNFKQLRARFQRAKDEGELGSDFDVDGAAHFFLSVQTGMSVLARDGAGYQALNAVARAGMTAWQGFAPSPGGKVHIGHGG